MHIIELGNITIFSCKHESRFKKIKLIEILGFQENVAWKKNNLNTKKLSWYRKIGTKENILYLYLFDTKIIFAATKMKINCFFCFL